MPLEKSLAAYKRGAELLKFCQAALQDAQQQVKILEGNILQDFKSDDRRRRQTDFPRWSHAQLQRVEAVLQKVLPAPEIAPQRLHQAMRYAVLGGGKRVRPLLAFAAGEVARRRRRARRDRRRGRRADPRLFAGARRPAVHGRRRAAARPADLPRRVRRGDRAARGRRAAEPRFSARRRSTASPTTRRRSSRW